MRHFSFQTFPKYFLMSETMEVLICVLGQMSRSGQTGQRLGARSGDISAAMISHRHWGQYLARRMVI